MLEKLKITCENWAEIPFDSADEVLMKRLYWAIIQQLELLFSSSRIFIVFNITFVEGFFRFKLGQATFGSTSITIGKILQ